MKYYIRMIILFLARPVFLMLHILPVKKNRILFCVFGGKFYGCNAKYIFEYLYNKYSTDIEYVWVINNKQAIPVV